MNPIYIRGFVVVLFLSMPSLASAQDVIEFLSGAKVEGKVTTIDAQGKQVTFEAVIGGKSFPRVYGYDRIHAVQYQGKRYVINEKVDTPTTPVRRPTTPAASTPSGNSSTPRPTTSGRAASDINAAIADAGRTLPDWFESTRLDFPPGLDLSWPEKPPGGWNNQKNVGQYIWDVINPNPTRWREGVRLMHHLITLHENNPDVKLRATKELARMHFELLQDYPRAAYWYLQAGVGKGGQYDSSDNAAHLAECYFRMGNPKMAADLMNRLPLTYAILKLWGDMGDTAKCVQMAIASAPNSSFPPLNYLVAGDAYRVAGDYKNALAAYQKVVQESQKPPQQPRNDKIRQRAQASIAALQALAAFDLNRVPDGTYRANSVGYEGPVDVEVTVAGNRIEAVKVTQHKEKQFYSSITDTTAKIVSKQGVIGVDATSGATITSEAIINASVKALASGTP